MAQSFEGRQDGTNASGRFGGKEGQRTAGQYQPYNKRPSGGDDWTPPSNLTQTYNYDEDEFAAMSAKSGWDDVVYELTGAGWDNEELYVA